MEVRELPWWGRAWEFLVNEPVVASSYAALAMGAALFGVSVFQTAVEAEQPTAIAWQDPGSESPELTPPATASLPQGMIYSTTATGLHPVAWSKATPFSVTSAARFCNLSLELPSEPVEAFSLIHFR